jgi:hypothetical protein
VEEKAKKTRKRNNNLNERLLTHKMHEIEKEKQLDSTRTAMESANKVWSKKIADELDQTDR